MGCGFTNRSEVEVRLNEFVNYLIVTQIKDTKYTERIRTAYNNNENSKLLETDVVLLSSRTNTNNPYTGAIANLQNLVAVGASNNRKVPYLLAFSLLFLTQSNPETLRTNYVLLKESFKSEFQNLTEVDQLISVLRYYFGFISQDILKAYKSNHTTFTSKEAQEISNLERYYDNAVIEVYMAQFIESYRKDFSLEKFFSQKADYLRHENVRDELKHFYSDSPLFGKKVEFKIPTPQLNIPNPANQLVSSSRYSFQAPNVNMPSLNVPTFNMPQMPSYNLPQSNYSVPQLNYSVPQLNYSAPQMNYSVPSVNLNNIGVVPRPGLKQEQVLNFRDSSLRLHNEIRANHGANQLYLNENLENQAQAWAETLAREDNLKSSTMLFNGLPMGENIAYADFEGCDPKMVIKSWYDQRANFNYSVNAIQKNCGSFSQIVWRKTSQYGFGVAQSSTGKVYFVANYFPAGNVKDEFIENVKPALFNH